MKQPENAEQEVNVMNGGLMDSSHLVLTLRETPCHNDLIIHFSMQQ
jgi:hypothetical protein